VVDKEILSKIGLMSVISLGNISDEVLNNILTDLSFFQVLRLMVMGFVLLDSIKLDGWKEKIPFYFIKCPVHSYQLSYPSGFGRTLKCPKCIRENEKKKL